MFFFHGNNYYIKLSFLVLQKQKFSLEDFVHVKKDRMS